LVEVKEKDEGDREGGREGGRDGGRGIPVAGGNWWADGQ